MNRHEKRGSLRPHINSQLARLWTLYGLHLKAGCCQSRSCCWASDRPASSSSTTFFSLCLLFHFIQKSKQILRISVVLLVARFSPFPLCFG